MVGTTLSSENITVSEDAAMFAGQHVNQPVGRRSQEANVIDKHADEISRYATPSYPGPIPTGPP